MKTTILSEPGIEVSQVKLKSSEEEIRFWLEKNFLPNLYSDPSSYSKNRRILWLNKEPQLFKPFEEKPGLAVPIRLTNRLKELIDWDFDYCLVSYSGSAGAGITPHRDAGYADYEAYNLNLTSGSEFTYWNDMKSFTKGPRSGVRHFNPPTHRIDMKYGTLIRFNCKNLHSSQPFLYRWAMSFWKKKPTK